MSQSYKHGRSRTTGQGARSQSTWSLPLATRNNQGQGQLVEHHDTDNDYGERYHQLGNERFHRPILRDHRAQTDDAGQSTRSIGWIVTTDSNGVEDSPQAAQTDGDEDEHDGVDEINGKHNVTNDDCCRRDPRRSSQPPQQWSRHDPPIANLVRSQAYRKSSHGRAFFSPAGLQNGEKAMTRYGEVRFPLLPISKHNDPSSLSQVALDFANIHSGAFDLCVKFLREHESLLDQDYHPYLQEAWKALWDEEKFYAHQCLSRWFLLDECRQIWPRDIGKHINRRSFSGTKFMDKVDDIYTTLKTLRQDVLAKMAQEADGAPGDANNLTSRYSIKGVRDFLQGIDREKVLSNVGNFYRMVVEVKRELQDRKQDS